MNTQSIQNLFQNKYEQTQWKSFLADIFKNSMFFSEPECLIGIDKNIASSAFKLGYIVFNENGTERHIAVFEVVTAQNIILERNRVGLRNLLKKFWNDFDAAFIVYHKQNEKNWRFTFVSEIREFNAQGDYVQSSTEPKRYTYLLGEGETIKTAAQRFLAVAEKGSQISLADIKDAFSVEKLSNEFFTEYKKHYDIFCNYCLAQPNIRQTIFNGNEKAIRDFNKKLLGRIVFLFFIQKKGWLGVPDNENWGNGDLNFLNNLFNNHKHSSTFYTLTLSKLFFDTLNSVRDGDLVEFDDYPKCRIPYLNGGLFEEENTNFRNISFDGSLFKNLFEFFAKYNFTIYEDDPNDHTVAVDPEMLGHIFENLLEDNKNNGTFYTPKEIVHYMCQESLIEYLAGWFEQKGYDVVPDNSYDKRNALFSDNEARKGQLYLEFDTQTEKKIIDRTLIEKLLKKKLDENDKELVCKHAKEFNLALDSVKICDPAIGSGAFPMGLLHEIFTAKQTVHFFQFGVNKDFNASKVKLDIIQNSIYGVDIEKGAVDIARLRFWLSLIVDENQPKPLPNLDFKIVCGNSLVSKLGDDIIDIDWKLENKDKQLYNTEKIDKKKNILSAIHKKQIEYFNSECNKKSLANEIRNLKIDLLINQLEIMISNKGIEKPPLYSDKKFKVLNEQYLKTIAWKKQIDKLKKVKQEPNATLEFFDWKLDFPDVMNENIAKPYGFDIVIGNPPYVNVEKIDKNIKDNIKLFNTAYQKYDLYVLFYEKAIDILSNSGILNFITSNKFLSQGYGLLLRKELLKYTINSIVNFNYDIFESATVRTCILQLKKQHLNNNYINIIDVNSKFDKEKFDNRIYEKLDQKIFLKTESNNFRINLNNTKIDLLCKIENNTQKIDEICSVNYGLRPVSTVPGEDKYTFIKYENDNKRYKPYFEGKDMGYWLISRNDYIDYIYDKLYNPMFKELFENEKLCGICTLSDISKLRFVYDNLGFYCNHSVAILTLWVLLSKVENKTIKRTITKERIENSKRYSYKYLQAILNSKLIKFYVNELMYDGTHFYPNHMKALPIKNVNMEAQRPFIEKVNQILSAKERGEDTCDLEREIDAMVYQLYELTAEEIAIVEGK